MRRGRRIPGGASGRTGGAFHEHGIRRRVRNRKVFGTIHKCCVTGELHDHFATTRTADLQTGRGLCRTGCVGRRSVRQDMLRGSLIHAAEQKVRVLGNGERTENVGADGERLGLVRPGNSELPEPLR